MNHAIFHISAYATDKYYGRALNEHIQCLPDDAWIALRDGDVMYLNHDWGEIIEQAVIDNPGAPLMTCRTNRAYGQGFDDNPDAIFHYYKSLNRPKAYTPITGIAPSFFWLFPKSVWARTPFDDHPIIYQGNSFDTRFFRKLPKGALMIEHLYVFHYYRLHDQSKGWRHLT